MKAIQFIGYGDIAKNVVSSEIETPAIGKDEVLIETYAAGVNPLDFKVIGGALKSVRKFKFPSTLGYDISGKISSIGENVTNFKIGDEVFSKVRRQGTFAEFVAVNQKYVALKPKNVSFIEAASLPLVGLIGVQALKRAKIKFGDMVLIHAGSGGVGSFAIQYAKALGAFVYTTTSTENTKWVKELGADVVIDYKNEDYKQIAKEVDIVFDTLGGSYTEDAFQVLRKGGRVVTLVGVIDKETALRMKLNPIVRMFLAWQRRKITKAMAAKSALYSLVFVRENADQLSEIRWLVEDEKIRPIIDAVFPLEDAKEALLAVKKGRTKGKVVIKIKE